MPRAEYCLARAQLYFLPGDAAAEGTISWSSSGIKLGLGSNIHAATGGIGRHGAMAREAQPHIASGNSSIETIILILLLLKLFCFCCVNRSVCNDARLVLDICGLLCFRLPQLPCQIGVLTTLHPSEANAGRDQEQDGKYPVRQRDDAH